MTTVFYQLNFGYYIQYVLKISCHIETVGHPKSPIDHFYLAIMFIHERKVNKWLFTNYIY